MKTIVASVILATTALAASAAPETYVFDPAHTLPSFAVTHFGMSTVRGLFEGSSGKAVIDRAAKTGSIEIKIPTATVYTGYLKQTGSGRTRDEHLRSADFFNTAEFPEMTYRSTKLHFNGDKLDSVEGTLTLLGVTKPLNLKVDSMTCGPNPFSKKDMCGGDLSGAIKRSDFGMKAFIPAVADEVKLLIAFEAYKQ